MSHKQKKKKNQQNKFNTVRYHFAFVPNMHNNVKRHTNRQMNELNMVRIEHSLTFYHIRTISTVNEVLNNEQWMNL